MKWNKFSVGFIFSLILVLSVNTVYADHLKGGWIKYVFLSQSGNSAQYKITFYQYSDCSEPEKVDDSIHLSIHDAGTGAEIGSAHNVILTKLTTESKTDFGPCFQNQPNVCYLIAEYNVTVNLPLNIDGYVVAVQRCCRIVGIENVANSNLVGLTYTVTIPGGAAYEDNSPVFAFNETVAICYNAPFTFDFSATDIDGDSLSYSLCSGLTGGTANDPVIENPPAPPYATIPYLTPYSGGQPLGPTVIIDPVTGIVSGNAPAQTGTYVVAVCVSEFRKGVYIGKTRKELHLNVANCSIGGALLDPVYITCDGLTFNFKNNASIDASYSYYWDFGVTGITTDTSTKATPSYTYPDTGVYNVQLKANNNKGCEDSAKAQVKIYPGFNTDFSINASCIQNPYFFKDLTTTKYGYVNSWKWFFGDGIDDSGTGAPPDDTTQNPAHNYTDTGTRTVMLITTNSKGCIDTAKKALDVTLGPDLQLAFPDTLICSIDTLQLKSSSTTTGATFNWDPPYNIINPNSNSPLIYPKTTTLYGITVSYKGCDTKDSVLVNVIDKVDLNLPNDTTICKTDSIILNPVTNGLYFSWSPPLGLNKTDVEYPVATPQANTNYVLKSSVGKCFATDNIQVNVVPYPSVKVSDDVSICYGATTQLNATIEGTYFAWSPSGSLINANTLTPIAGPQQTTDYILNVTDTIGCPKPGSDTVRVTVIPTVKAFAGNDTVVVRSQPLQLNATGGTNYKWDPIIGLSDPFIANPVLNLTGLPDTVLYSVRVSTPEGCYNTDSIKIIIFNSQPEVFIPTAFTPNGDGRNDVFRPIVAGMKKFMYLRIYNRWGQLLFNSGNPGVGWDGTFKGQKQPAGAYVYVIQAVDYTDKPYLKKGTFVLIR
ncbi:MAG: gliding motility-associated C-terminal domain-containing protein [Bacteroidetes bacterium]|nr:gliding motility-associated C-terminal domain-containing protein [Bacteroidota bacterium]